jgi:hypothetical protein
MVAAQQVACFDHPMIKPGKASKWAARSERLSAALRENLKRRKAQARGRTGAKAEEPAATEAGTAPDFRRNPGGKLGGGAGGPGSGRGGS